MWLKSQVWLVIVMVKKEYIKQKIRAFRVFMLWFLWLNEVYGVGLNQKWHTTLNSYLKARFERNAFLVLGNRVYHVCDCSNDVDKDSFAIVRLVTLQKLTYVAPAWRKHIYNSSVELCITTNWTTTKVSPLQTFHHIKYVIRGQQKYGMLSRGCWVILWVKQKYKGNTKRGFSFYLIERTKDDR